MGLGKFIANRSFKKYRKITESNLKRSQDFLKSSILANDKTLRVSIECSEYLMINMYDLFVLSYNYLASKNNWDKILYSRIMALYLIDFYEKIFPLIGKEVITEVDHIADIKTVESIKLICKRIAKIRNESQDNLRYIRNLTIAHKTNSGNHLLDEINKIDHKRINDYVSELTGLMTKLSNQLTDILKAYIRIVNNGT